MLEARNVTFEYSPGNGLLDAWSAQFPTGTTTALTGPSGSGKSTLLYLLGLMLHPIAGEILVEGMSASEFPDSGRAWLRAHRFGFVFQDSALDPTRTVLENVTETMLYRSTPRRLGIERAEELLDRFGVDVPRQRKPGQVSGGQAQRIALCRALLPDPAILLADEPTGNLDPNTAQVVIDALKDHARRGGTVVIVTHSPEVAATCDREIRL